MILLLVTKYFGFFYVTDDGLWLLIITDFILILLFEYEIPRFLGSPVSEVVTIHYVFNIVIIAVQVISAWWFKNKSNM